MDPTPANDAPKPDPGLPPVQPPSARFISQLFVIPGAIILVIVLSCVASMVLVDKQKDPNYFLKQLDSENLDIRWRGASDLAQILKRPEAGALRWKADVIFALDLAERLETARKELLDEEAKVAAEIAKSTDKNRDLPWRPLRQRRDYVSYLSSTLGEFHVPVGAPILCTIAKYDASPDLKGNTLQRRKAMWSLMNLGENLKAFAKFPPDQQQTILAALKEEAGKGNTPRASWAKTALSYLDSSSPKEGIVRVDETLALLADSDDRFLRELVAMAFNFWDGPQAEATLLKLARDTGRGTLLRVEEND